MPMIQLTVSPADPSWSAAEEQEGGIELRDRLAGREEDGDRAPDEQATEGDDERGDADVGDQHAVQAADGGAKAEPEGTVTTQV